MNNNLLYDVAIVGGGLAGLGSSIQLARAGYKVVLFEKEKYPFHKVCGEYISMESWSFLQRLGLPLDKMNLPLVKNLIVSSPNGKTVKSTLEPGGFGISRFLIDHELCKIARQNGVEVYEETKVNDITFHDDVFTITTSSFSIQSRAAIGSFGKRSNIDVKWERDFIKQKPNKLNNYIGVKYHIKTNYPAETIALHNFENGYCGISEIEDDKYCLCYLTTAQNLKANNSIIEMEKNILQKNPFLKELFSSSHFLYSSPITISQISFERKSLIEDHVMMTGDAAGMITPLCGNGMSMALQGSKIAFEVINNFLQNKTTRHEMEAQYQKEWNNAFSKRLRNGRLIQRLFGKKWTTDLFITMIKPFPGLVKKLIRSTHGESF